LFIPDHEKLALQVFDNPRRNVYSTDNVASRLRSLFARIRQYFMNEASDDRLRLLAELNALSEVCQHLSENCQRIREFIDDMIKTLSVPQAAPLSLRDKWSEETLSDRVSLLPSAHESNKKKYYKWLGRTLEGKGEVVELGVWMGGTTNCVGEGMMDNPVTTGHYIYAYDLFIWQPWMTRPPVKDLINQVPELKTVKAGDDFLEIYLKICHPIRSYVKPVRCAISLDDPRYRHIPSPSWHGAPIELFLYDLDQGYRYIEESWRIFSRSFIHGETILVFNPYGNVRAEGVRRFILDRGESLRPLHKPDSAAKAYLYLG
jgi:hypothetical protein